MRHAGAGGSNLQRTILPLFAFLLLLTLPFLAPAPAQEPKPVEDEDPLSSLVDPGLDDSENTLSRAAEPFDGDPALLDSPDSYGKEELGLDPSDFGFEESYSRAAAGAAFTGMSCASPPASVTPIGLGANLPQNVGGSSPRYLSYTGVPRVLVGASADSVCHWRMAPPAPGQPAIDVCNFDNFQLLLCDLNGNAQACDRTDPLHPVPRPSPGAPRLNKIRLWVVVAGEKDVANVPFARVAVRETTPFSRSYTAWDLANKNADYFDRLRKVVAMAKELGIFVEVTFFAPWQGTKTFANSPWYYNPSADTTASITPNSVVWNGSRYVQVGFKGPSNLSGSARAKAAVKYFVLDDPSSSPPDQGMRQYQRKVIEWTIDTLWCFDNVIWEIANEPEDRSVSSAQVATWLKARIGEAVAYETRARFPKLSRPHLLSAQPFTTLVYDQLRTFQVQDPNAAPGVLKRPVSLFSGHYTQVLTDITGSSPQQLNLGAIQLARRAASTSLAIGFNETKITPYGGLAGVMSHVDAANDRDLGVVWGRAEPGRSEGWELLMEQGATYDHWGYLNGGQLSGTSSQIRNQLAKLKTFFDQLAADRARFERLKPSDGSWVYGAWVPGLGWSLAGGTKVTGLPAYPEGLDGWESATSSQRYWASLATSAGDASRIFLLYTHHSTRRCHYDEASNQAPFSFTSTGCPSYLGVGGYDARVWNVNPPGGSRYQDRLRVKLGTAPGTFKVEWLNPATLASTQAVPFQTLVWSPAGGGSCGAIANCILCNNANTCELTSPNYSYDNLLKITQQ